MSAQLALLRPAPAAPTWSLEGVACTSCGVGRMQMIEPSDPCACAEALCICLAEGYALCDHCGDVRQVWPREMETAWAVAS